MTTNLELTQILFLKNSTSDLYKYKHILVREWRKHITEICCRVSIPHIIDPIVIKVIKVKNQFYINTAAYASVIKAPSSTLCPLPGRTRISFSSTDSVSKKLAPKPMPQAIKSSIIKSCFKWEKWHLNHKSINCFCKFSDSPIARHLENFYGTRLMESLNYIEPSSTCTISDAISFQLDMLVGPLCFDR